MRSSVEAPGRGRSPSAAARPERAAPPPERVIRANAPSAAKKVAATARSLKRLGRVRAMAPWGPGRGLAHVSEAPPAARSTSPYGVGGLRSPGVGGWLGSPRFRAESNPECGEGTYGNVDRYETSFWSTPSP